MMETNLPDSGFLTCFYYTGRHTTDFACDARDQNQLRLEKKMRAAAARHAPFTPPAPDAVTLGGPQPAGRTLAVLLQPRQHLSGRFLLL